MGLLREGNPSVWRIGDRSENFCRLWSPNWSGGGKPSPVSGEHGRDQGILAESGVTMGVVREGYSRVWREGEGSGNFCRVPGGDSHDR